MDTIVHLFLAVALLVVVLLVVGRIHDFRSLEISSRSQRENGYKHCLGALAKVKGDPSDRRALGALSDAANAIALVAPPQVVSQVARCCRQLDESGSCPDAELVRQLVLVFREDLSIASVDTADVDFEFELVPTGSKARAT